MTAAGFAGLTVGLVAYGVLVYGLDSLAAVVGLQEAAWPYVGIVIWVVRIVSAAGAIATGIRCRAWFKRTTRAKRYIFMTLWVPLLFVVVFLASAWAAFAGYDSDYMLVSRGMINHWLPEGLEIPETAENVRAVLTGGIDPGAALRFELPPDKAEEYLADALRMAETEGYRDLHTPEEFREMKQYTPYAWRPSSLALKDWWQPDDEGQWVDKGTRNGSFFIQRSSDGRTLYVSYNSS